MKTKKSIKPKKLTRLKKKKTLKSLLPELREEALSQPCTRYNSSIVDCCNVIIWALEGRDG